MERVAAEKTRRISQLKRIAVQHAKGKLTARERLSLLLDKDSFVEAHIVPRRLSSLSLSLSLSWGGWRETCVCACLPVGVSLSLSLER